MDNFWGRPVYDDALPSPPAASEQADDILLISVIITNYNYEKFLGHAIQSVLDQSYPHVQCIVVDDGSTDNSLAVARGYAGVEVIEKPNGGQVSAAKAAMAAVRGQITLFLDSDDSLYPDACAIVARDVRPGVTLYQYGLDIVDADNVTIATYPRDPLLSHSQREWAVAHGFFPASPTSGNAFATDHVRRMLAESGANERYFVDGYLIYSAPFFGEVAISTKKLGQYLVHGGNVSLSSGVNERSAEKSVRNALWQRNGIVNALRLTGQPAGTAADFLTAYHLRYILVLRRCYHVADLIPEWSDWKLARVTLGKFLKYPEISLRQRLQNIVFILATLAGVTGFGRRLIPPAAS